MSMTQTLSLYKSKGIFVIILVWKDGWQDATIATLKVQNFAILNELYSSLLRPMQLQLVVDKGLRIEDVLA